MNRVFIVAICFLCFGELGCIATTRGTVTVDRSTAIAAASTAASNLGMTVEEEPLQVVLVDEVFPLIETHTIVEGADLFVTTGDKGYPAQGAVRLTASGPAQVDYEGIFSTNLEVGPSDLGALFLELTNQQVRLDAGTQPPHVNPTKSGGHYAALTLCTPIAGLHYAGAGNPYLTGDRTLSYVGSAVGDAVMVGCLTAAFLVDSRDTRSTLVIVGVSTAMAWRLLSLVGLKDISVYNSLARSDYDLEAALHAIEAKENQLRR